MFKTIGAALALAMMAGSAFAGVGTPPLSGGGPALIDQTWALGVASDQNNSYQSGLIALGTTQATGLQLPAGIAMIEVDTTASGTGVNLPPCFQGSRISLYNNGANTLTIYPAVANNPLTAAQDTINNATSITVATHLPESFTCAKNGVWSAK